MSRRTTLIARALQLRCPNCGSRGVFQHWFAMKTNCPACQISLAVGNPVGANLLNLVTAEVVVMIGLGTVIAARWPDIPWTFLQFGVPALAILSPMFFFPFSKLVFIAFDLAMHPEGKPDERVHGVK